MSRRPETAGCGPKAKVTLDMRGFVVLNVEVGYGCLHHLNWDNQG